MSVRELANAPFARQREALDAGEVSSVELTEESLRRFSLSTPQLNSALTTMADSALCAAQVADARLARGERHPVLGVPVGVKDLVMIKGVRTTAASKMLENFVAPYEATITTHLQRDGAVLPAKLNLDEFAMGSSNENSFFGVCPNPWDFERVPGGSSGGSAVAVAARQCTLAIGTDTGGSIRQPAAFSGITGLKPTYGRVSRFGVIAFASSLDQVGPMGSDALACSALLESLAGYDDRDATSVKRPVPPYYADTLKAHKGASLKGLRVGVPRDYFGEGLQGDVAKAVNDSLETFKSLGAELVDIELPTNALGIPVYYMISTAEASSNLARYSGVHYGHRTAKTEVTLDDLYSHSRAEGFGPEVRLRVLTGTYALSSGYYDAFFIKAAKVRRLIVNDFKSAFARCDVIAGPTTPSVAFKFGEKSVNPMAMYLSDVYTVTVNLAGLPALSMNCGFTPEKLPVGLQLIAPWWEDQRALSVASVFQRERPDTLSLSPVAQGYGS